MKEKVGQSPSKGTEAASTASSGGASSSKGGDGETLAQVGQSPSKGREAASTAVADEEEPTENTGKPSSNTALSKDVGVPSKGGNTSLTLNRKKADAKVGTMN